MGGKVGLKMPVCVYVLRHMFLLRTYSVHTVGYMHNLYVLSLTLDTRDLPTDYLSLLSVQ
jgi:hypothetical protein